MERESNKIRGKERDILLENNIKEDNEDRGISMILDYNLQTRDVE